ncbi:hypothetical protein C8R47DRAFT_1315960 [Mycena vitilis]|nr:hypothetical protein C8R47DRAFT_1315960 [Mycena vitilis]
MTLMSIDDRLGLLRLTLKAGLPVTAGVHPVNAEDLILYYDVDEKPNRIHLGNATEDQLSYLSCACRAEANNIGNATGIVMPKAWPEALKPSSQARSGPSQAKPAVGLRRAQGPGLEKL